MVPLRGDFKMCKNWNMSEKTVPILFVGDGFLSRATWFTDCVTTWFTHLLLGHHPKGTLS